MGGRRLGSRDQTKAGLKPGTSQGQGCSLGTAARRDEGGLLPALASAHSAEGQLQGSCSLRSALPTAHATGVGAGKQVRTCAPPA